MISNFVSSSLSNVVIQYKSARKRILSFEDKNFNEVRFHEKSGITTRRCSKRPFKPQIFAFDDLFVEKNLNLLRSVLPHELEVE